MDLVLFWLEVLGFVFGILFFCLKVLGLFFRGFGFFGSDFLGFGFLMVFGFA